MTGRAEPVDAALRAAVRTAVEDGDQWSALASLGVFGFGTAVDAGGLDLGLPAALMVCEELGRALAPTLALDTFTAADWLAEAGGDPETRKRVAAGELPVAVASGPVLSGGLLTGSAPYVASPDRAGALLVPVSGAGCYLVRDAGWTFRRRDLPGELHEVALHGVPVTEADQIEWSPLIRARERVRRAGYLVGLAEQAYALTVRHARARRQFDRALIDHQVVAFRLAERHALVAAARRLAVHAAGVVDGSGGEGSPPALALAAQALATAVELALDATRDGVQLHGAFGMTAAARIQRYYRRAPVEAARAGRASDLWIEAGRLRLDALAEAGRTP
jgi:alkylation response protein AidB-like acyl-CoA dehydrogenase